MTTITNNHSTGRYIWETIMGLHRHGQNITRQRLMELTGLVYTKVDDHVSRWIDDGQLRRTNDGIYEVVEPRPEPRPIFITDLPDGMTLIEVGEQQMRIWPWERQIIGVRFHGDAMQLSNLQVKHDMGALLAEATVQKRELSSEVAELKRGMQELERQLKETQTGAQMELIAP